MDFALNFYEQNQRVLYETEDENQHRGSYFPYEYNSNCSLDFILITDLQFITMLGSIV